MIKHIPNILSFFRLCLAFAFPFVQEKFWVVLILCGGASDFLDGWIARRWNLTSWQGGLLDAIADKLFVLSALTTFVLAGKFSVWWLPVIIARDLAVAFIALYAVCIKAWASFKEMDARWSGKVATAGQFLLMLVVVIVPDYTFYTLYLVAVMSFVAAFDYAKEFVKALLLRKTERKNKSDE